VKKLAIIILPLCLISCIETVAVMGLGSTYLVTRNRPVKDSFRDTKITAEIAQRINIFTDKFALRNVSFNVYQGRVLLTGYANDKKILDNAVKDIWKIKGVAELMNEVEVKTKSSRNVIYDHFLASQVKAKLFMNEDIKSLDINVEVFDKKVYLIGGLSEDKQIRIAANIAAKVKGVKSVVSYIRKTKNVS
jgi:osmotically-inducible protein OsmY